MQQHRIQTHVRSRQKGAAQKDQTRYFVFHTVYIHVTATLGQSSCPTKIDWKSLRQRQKTMPLLRLVEHLTLLAMGSRSPTVVNDSHNDTFLEAEATADCVKPQCIYTMTTRLALHMSFSRVHVAEPLHTRWCEIESYIKDGCTRFGVLPSSSKMVTSKLVLRVNSLGNSGLSIVVYNLWFIPAQRGNEARLAWIAARSGAPPTGKIRHPSP